VLSVTHAHSTKNDLVNEVVIAIRGSLNACRRKLVKEIFVQFPTYEVAHALDEDLSKRIGDDFSSNHEQQRVVAILLALKDLGSLTSCDRGGETWFFFDPKENLADDVLRIRLKKSELERAIELSKRIAPTLEQAWQRVAEIDGHPRDSQNYEFELDPFISQLARWADKEVTTERPEFKAVDLAERIARICLELQENDVAIRTGTEVFPVWATAVAIDRRIGGAKISHNARFSISNGTNPTLVVRFQKAINEHLKGRLASMLETEEAFFQLCNMGKMKIATIDPEGHYLWALVGSKRRVGANVRRQNSKVSR
jgi:hypothetical protein